MKKLVLAILFVLSLLSVPAMAAVSTDYQITEVQVDDITYANADDIVYVERGSTIEIELYLEGTGNTEDVNVKAWLGGYEYDYVQTTSSMFDIEDGVSYKKTLNLQLPNDMNAEQDYTLYVEVYDDQNYVREDFDLRVSKERHDIRVYDVIVDNQVDAGDYGSVLVRLENMGDHKEEDLRVEVSSEALGIEVATYLDELTNDERPNRDEETSGDVTLNFEVPADAETGAYDLNVEVTYNRGHSLVEDTAVLNVLGAQEDAGEVTVTVTDSEEPTSTEDDETRDFSTALKLGFGILAVLIVILALILIVRR